MNSAIVIVSLRVADLEMGYDRTAFTLTTIEVVIIEDGAPALPRLFHRYRRRLQRQRPRCGASVATIQARYARERTWR